MGRCYGKKSKETDASPTKNARVVRILTPNTADEIQSFWSAGSPPLSPINQDEIIESDRPRSTASSNDVTSKAIRRGSYPPGPLSEGARSRLSKLVEVYGSPSKSPPRPIESSQARGDRTVAWGSPLTDNSHHTNNQQEVEDVLETSNCTDDASSDFSCESSMLTEDFYHEVIDRLKKEKWKKYGNNGIDDPPVLNRMSFGNKTNPSAEHEDVRNDSNCESGSDGKEKRKSGDKGFEIRFNEKADEDHSFAGQHSINTVKNKDNSVFSIPEGDEVPEDQFRHAFHELMHSQNSIASRSESASFQFRDAFDIMRNQSSVCASTIAESFISEIEEPTESPSSNSNNYRARVSIEICGESKEDVDRIISDLRSDISNASTGGSVYLSFECSLPGKDVMIADQTPNTTGTFDEESFETDIVTDTFTSSPWKSGWKNKKGCWPNGDLVATKEHNITPTRGIVRHFKNATSRALRKVSGGRKQTQFRKIEDDEQHLLNKGTSIRQS